MAMRRPGSLFVRAVVAASLLVGASAPVVAPAAATRPAQSTGELPPPKAQIVVDAATGAVLAGDHIHDALYPASLVKIMTALVAVERLPENETIPVSTLAASKPPMKITMQEGQRWPLEHAIASMMMVSANDAAFAIAEHAGGGSIEGFADVATDAAERFGLRDSTISDPSGLDDESSHNGGSRMSAYDLAIVTRNALSVPVIAKYAAMPEYSFTDPAGQQRYLPNHNKLVVEGGGNHYGGATGFKTGYTDQAQHTLVATATRDGRTLVAVLLGAPTYGYAEAAALLDFGFSTPADADGTGERLPEVAVSPYATRLADQQAFMALASSTSATDGTTAAVSSVPVEAAAPLAARETRSSQSGDETDEEGGGGSGLLSTRNVIVVAVVLLAALVMLRRRAVKRQRARRIARQRARAAQMRSGGLPVVDGKYRAGMRLGPPVESHVRIRRAGDNQPRRHGTG
jgi:D-alanyl-D-alanine carboxypeptidase